MIDTDKYEGHSMGWSLDSDDWLWATNMFTAEGEENEADALLIGDAPLLLEEVKQIHEILREAFTTEAKHSGAEYLNMIARITGLIE